MKNETEVPLRYVGAFKIKTHSIRTDSRTGFKLKHVMSKVKNLTRIIAKFY